MVQLIDQGDDPLEVVCSKAQSKPVPIHPTHAMHTHIHTNARTHILAELVQSDSRDVSCVS